MFCEFLIFEIIKLLQHLYLSFPPSSPPCNSPCSQIHYLFLNYLLISTHMYVFTHILLNITCSEHTMLLIIHVFRSDHLKFDNKFCIFINNNIRDTMNSIPEPFLLLLIQEFILWFNNFYFSYHGWGKFQVKKILIFKHAKLEITRKIIDKF